jgi:6,7-dimethyl-8-ribityllumazine synthase
VRIADPGGTPDAPPPAEGLRFALAISRFNAPVTESLANGAREALVRAGALEDDVEEVWVPGAYELPQAARVLAQSGRFDAVICLGCVIRGETPHFEYISAAVANGIMQAAADTGVPITFGVLTTDTLEQAEQRSGAGRDNKGWEAAAAAIEMAVLFRQIRRDA